MVVIQAMFQTPTLPAVLCRAGQHPMPIPPLSSCPLANEIQPTEKRDDGLIGNNDEGELRENYTSHTYSARRYPVCMSTWLSRPLNSFRQAK